MESIPSEAERWRERAAEARAGAAEMHDPNARLVMLEIAENYERLAKYAEARASRPPGGETLT
jgi:hypothetical protein